MRKRWYGDEQCFRIRKPTGWRVIKRFRAINLGEKDMNDNECWVSDTEIADPEPQEVRPVTKPRKSRNKQQPQLNIKDFKRANKKPAKR